MTAPIFSNHGCRLNAYETEAMKDLAQQAGLENAVIVNTCAVTAEAVRKARQDIRKLRKANPNARLIVTGCAAQTEPDTFAKMAEVDAVIGNTEKMVGATWQGLAADFIGESEAVQVDDIMSVPMFRSRTVATIAVHFVSSHLGGAIRVRYQPAWWWIRSSGWSTKGLMRSC
jgi:threonylcarbamoyladenosine tRNA methylthiotransferase MtaB